MTNAKSERWARLSDKYKQVLKSSKEEAFVAGRFALHLQTALAEACGCDASYVTFYRYQYGYAPEGDSSEKVKSSFEAVGSTEDGWVFALGVQLEVGPNGYPKTVAIFPITVRISQVDGTFTITSALFESKAVVHDTTYKADLDRLAEKMFEGIEHQLDLWIAGEKAARGIGFNV